MKFASVPLVVGALAPLVHAWPASVMEAAARNPEILVRAQKLVDDIARRSANYVPRSWNSTNLLNSRQSGADAATAIFEPAPYFNAKEQYVDVSPGSGHEYKAPGPGDIRGPCPGLNAFANHGFLPHDGYATVDQFIAATTEVVGMGPVLAAVLSLLGGALDGDITDWSIGGTPTLTIAGPVGILGNGLSGSHNKYEGDASPTRPDLYQTGSNDKVVVSQFQDMINYSPGGALTLDSLTDFRSHRFDQQVAANPYFFFGPFSGIAVQPAAFAFIYRFMANHSDANPTGLLSYEVAQSWFGVQGTNGHYTAQPGTERIPDNWYKRPLAYPYEVDYFLADVNIAALIHPKFLSVGGNTGKTNTFTGVDLEQLTGGLFNTATLLQGNNLGCFIFQASAQAKPDILLGLLTQLTNAIGNIIGPLACPQLQTINDKQLQQFPGYKKAAVY